MRNNHKIDDCCYRCSDRKVGCHGDCERYTEAKKQYLETKKKIASEHVADAYECMKFKQMKVGKTKFLARTCGYKNIR